MHLKYGYSLKGQKAVTITNPKSINYSLIAAISMKGIHSFQIFKGGVKSQDFNGFMVKLLLHLNLHEQEKDIVFFMDNASIHKNFDLRQELATQITIIYNAPYSPFLNPIEECFSLWKYLVRKSHANDERGLVEAILSGSHQIGSEDCKRFIKHSIKFLDPSFKNEDIF